MKKNAILLFLLLMCCINTALGYKVTLEWDANTEPDIAGYKLHYRNSSGNYSAAIVDAGNTTTITVPGLTQGLTYYFVVTAYNDVGLESPPSNEVSYTVPILSPPANLSLVGTNLQWSYPPALVSFRVEKADGDGPFLVWSPIETAKEKSIIGLSPGSYRFRVKAVNNEGDVSEPSNVYNLTIPLPPIGLRIRVTLQSSTNLNDWNNLSIHEEDAEEKKYFRLVVETK